LEERSGLDFDKLKDFDVWRRSRYQGPSCALTQRVDVRESDLRNEQSPRPPLAAGLEAYSDRTRKDVLAFPDKIPNINRIAAKILARNPETARE
jgi:hypothetical protein